MTVALGAALLTAVASLGGVYLLTRHQREQSRLERRERLMERSAAVIGPLWKLLQEGNPDRVSMNLGPRSGEAHEDRWSRWQTIHTEALTVATMHPSAEVRTAFRDASVAVGNALMSAGWIVRDYLANDFDDRRSQREEAKADHRTASAALERLEELLRQG
ncbi:MAG: hypothetical protein AB7I08_02765 [Thermoleophilia bacterium]